METTILVGLTYRWRRLEGAAMLAGRKGRRGLATEAHQEEGGVSRKRGGANQDLGGFGDPVPICVRLRAPTKDAPESTGENGRRMLPGGGSGDQRGGG